MDPGGGVFADVVHDVVVEDLFAMRRKRFLSGDDAVWQHEKARLS